MATRTALSWSARLSKWRRFDSWRAPESARERRTRIAWLRWAVDEAGRRGLLGEAAFDDPGDLARRRRIREALARVRA